MLLLYRRLCHNNRASVIVHLAWNLSYLLIVKKRRPSFQHDRIIARSIAGALCNNLTVITWVFRQIRHRFHHLRPQI